IALPTYFHTGGVLLEIDRHLSTCAGGWMFDALLDDEAEWMSQEQLDEGQERFAELQQAIDESRDEGDTDADELDRAEEALRAVPSWFLTLTDGQLEAIAYYPLHESGIGLRRKFRRWTKPTPEMFLRPSDPANLQHIVAAYLLAR